MSQTTFTADDFAVMYEKAQALVAQESIKKNPDLPDYENWREAISEMVEPEDQPFADFEAFFNWWDVVSAYDQMDVGEKAIDFKPMLAVAYLQMLADGLITGGADGALEAIGYTD